MDLLNQRWLKLSIVDLSIKFLQNFLSSSFYYDISKSGLEGGNMAIFSVLGIESSLILQI